MPDVVVIGAGPMGALHARTVAACSEARLVGVHDVHRDRAETLAEQHGCSAQLEAADLYIVATPAHTHLDVAVPLLNHAWVLVEKPLSLVWDPRWSHPRALAAWSERFHPGWAAVRVQRSFRSVRERVRRATDTDVVGDLLIHDLDLLLSKVQGVQIKGVRGGGERVEVDLDFMGGTARLLVDGSKRGRVEQLVDGRLHRRCSVGPDPLTRQLRAVFDQMRTGRGSLRAVDSRPAIELSQQIREGCCALAC